MFASGHQTNLSNGSTSATASWGWIRAFLRNPARWAIPSVSSGNAVPLKRTEGHALMCFHPNIGLTTLSRTTTSMWSPTNQATAHATSVMRGFISLALMRDGISPAGSVIPVCMRPCAPCATAYSAHRPTSTGIRPVRGR